MRLKPQPKQLNGPIDNLLLVEGDEDLNVVKHLLIKFGLSPRIDYYNIRVRVTEGYPAYLDHLWDSARESGLKRIGLLIDADRDIAARWKSLTYAINAIDTELGNRLPKNPDREGTVIEIPNGLRLGIWLMPDNGSPGAVEEFSRSLLPDEDLLWPHVEASISGLPTRLFTDVHEMKAKLNTWLAWQKKPGSPIGIAIYEGWLNPEAKHALLFKNWLQQLFEL